MHRGPGTRTGPRTGHQPGRPRIGTAVNEGNADDRMRGTQAPGLPGGRGGGPGRGRGAAAVAARK
jgi:hypothetical protein